MRLDYQESFDVQDTVNVRSMPPFSPTPLHPFGYHGPHESYDDKRSVYGLKDSVLGESVSETMAPSVPSPRGEKGLDPDLPPFEGFELHVPIPLKGMKRFRSCIRTKEVLIGRKIQKAANVASASF